MILSASLICFCFVLSVCNHDSHKVKSEKAVTNRFFSAKNASTWQGIDSCRPNTISTSVPSFPLYTLDRNSMIRWQQIDRGTDFGQSERQEPTGPPVHLDSLVFFPSLYKFPLRRWSARREGRRVHRKGKEERGKGESWLDVE